MTKERGTADDDIFSSSLDEVDAVVRENRRMMTFSLSPVIPRPDF